AGAPGQLGRQVRAGPGGSGDVPAAVEVQHGGLRRLAGGGPLHGAASAAVPGPVSAMAPTPPTVTSAAVTSAGYGRTMRASNDFRCSAVLWLRSNGSARMAASMASRCCLLISPPRVQGVRTALPDSRPPADWSWTAGRSASG